jgi:hypothetical protein
MMDDPHEEMLREMEAEEEYEYREEMWEESDIDRVPPISEWKSFEEGEEFDYNENPPIDRSGAPLKVGDRVKLVGSSRESTVHVNDNMHCHFNTGKILRIRAIRDFSPRPVFKIDGADDWSWSHKNIEKVLFDPPKKAKPTLFDPALLDLN